MSKQEFAGVYQLENGYWGYRYSITINGKKKGNKKIRDDEGKPFKTQRQASKARAIAIEKEKDKAKAIKKDIPRKTVQEIYKEYCENGRTGKAYATIKKQDSLWKNHLCKRFGKRYIDDISVAEINDYLSELYYVDDRAYTYVESFLKMFYLIFGQAYSRDYLDIDIYNKLCKNKDTKIHMPKVKIDEDLDIAVFTDAEMKVLDAYFKDSNAETAYLLGKHCGLRINECYGLRWDNVNFKEGYISIERQMQYQEGLIKLVPLKTRNAKRKVYMSNKLKRYLEKMKKQQDEAEQEQYLQRQQNQTFIYDEALGKTVSSLELVNSLFNGKIQTNNSMKYHSRTLQAEHNILFKYHYLRHTYGTYLANSNTPVFVLCNQMGHASCNVTQKYYVGQSKQGLEILKNNLNRR